LKLFAFLQAPNRNRLEFALMWASQVWMNVHPAVGPSVPYGNRSPQFGVPQLTDSATFDAMTTYIVDKYFSQPNYQRVQVGDVCPLQQFQEQCLWIKKEEWCIC